MVSCCFHRNHQPPCLWSARRCLQHAAGAEVTSVSSSAGLSSEDSGCSAQRGHLSEHPFQLSTSAFSLSLSDRWEFVVLETLGPMSHTWIFIRPSAFPMEEAALAWGPSGCKFWATGFKVALETENGRMAPNLLLSPWKFWSVQDTFICTVPGGAGVGAVQGALLGYVQRGAGLSFTSPGFDHTKLPLTHRQGEFIHRVTKAASLEYYDQNWSISTRKCLSDLSLDFQATFLCFFLFLSF